MTCEQCLDGLRCDEHEPRPTIEMSIWEPEYRCELDRLVKENHQLREKVGAMKAIGDQIIDQGTGIGGYLVNRWQEASGND